MENQNKDQKFGSNKNSSSQGQSKGGKNELPFFLIILAIFIVLGINYIASKMDFDKIVLVDKELVAKEENPFLVHEPTLDEEVVVEKNFFEKLGMYFDSFRSSVCDDSAGSYVRDEFPDFTLNEDGVVCFKGREISGIDTQSFTPVGQAYFKDQDHVYKILLDSDNNKRKVTFIDLNLDAETFTIVDEKVDGSAIMKDERGVYYLDVNNKEPNPIFGADTKTFELFHVCSVVDKYVGSFYKDKNKIYNDKGPINHIDLASFEYLGIYSNQDSLEMKGSYTRDKNSAYFGCGAVLSDADVRSFVDLGDGFAKDDERVWYFGVPIENADSDSFQSLGQGYARDRFNFYLEDRVVEEEDISKAIQTSTISLEVN